VPPLAVLAGGMAAPAKQFEVLRGGDECDKLIELQADGKFTNNAELLDAVSRH